MKLLKNSTALFLAMAVCVLSMVCVAADTLYYASNCYYTYINNDTVSLKGWDSAESTVVAPPATLNGRTLVSVAKRAFYEDSVITGIDLSQAQNIAEIGLYAFSKCSALTQPVVLPASITYIGECAFEKSAVTNITFHALAENIPTQCCYICDSLTTVTIDGVQRIDSYAFANCPNLSKVTISESVTEIDDTAFNNDSNLTIYCYDSSYAHTFAISKGIPYILLDSVLLGDANGDGYVNISDVTDIQRAVAEMDSLDDLRKKAADINGDGVVTIDDATILQMYLAEFATDYPIGVVTAQ